MSMNFSEFKKLMGADPGNRDPETLRARQSSPEFEAVAAEAEAFEEKLQAALRIQPPAELLSQDKGYQPATRRGSAAGYPLALAASLLIFIGAAGLVWKQSQQWDSVEAYVADHYSHDGSRVIARTGDRVSEQDISKILARLDASADRFAVRSHRVHQVLPDTRRTGCTHGRQYRAGADDHYLYAQHPGSGW